MPLRSFRKHPDSADASERSEATEEGNAWGNGLSFGYV